MKTKAGVEGTCVIWFFFSYVLENVVGRISIEGWGVAGALGGVGGAAEELYYL